MKKHKEKYKTAKEEKVKFVLVMSNFAKSEKHQLPWSIKVNVWLYRIILNSLLIETGVS